MQAHVLFESALGFGLFSTAGAEVIGQEVAAVQEASQDLSKFGKLVKLHAFQPFKSVEDALDNMNQVSEGECPESLRSFLEAHLPKNSNKKNFTLGVGESKLATSIANALDIGVSTTDAVPELIRGIRMHFTKLCSGIKDPRSLDKAQMGLGHSYSRGKVKFNVHRVDNMIIQAICLLDQLDKDINTFSMRVKEWYSYHFPELAKIVNDNIMFARLAKFIGRRSTLSDESLDKLEELTMDSAKSAQILQAARSSMGMDVSDIDLLSISRFAVRVSSLADYRQSLHEYLKSKMHSCAPNLANLIGEQVGARLISHAGSLTNLAKYPASTVQILGAEKALFRALKTRGNTPKYGLIFHSTFIGRAATKNKGRISRYLANKCSMASRIDCFSDTITGKFGEEMRAQVEERLQFYETGEAPRRNLAVMRKVISDLGDDMSDGDDEEKPAAAAASAAATPSSEKKKKKKKDKRTASEADSPSSEKKAKKAKKVAPDSSEKKKKKKKKKAE